MKISRRALRFFGLLLLGFGFVFGCGFDDTLREYLDAHFWLPFSKQSWHFERKNVKRISAPYAGMVKAVGTSPLANLRRAYQQIPALDPSNVASETALLRDAVAAARADRSLTPREKEEVDLIDAKIDMRLGQASEPEPLRSSKGKLEKFLQTAQTPEFLSEARGWLAYMYFLFGEQTAAGKIYLDELNRDGSNLSRETLLTSLRMTYGYDGGPALREHLQEYFDTPEHAAFAIQMVTNPRWDRSIGRQGGNAKQADQEIQWYKRVVSLLESHRALLNSERGANALALLFMRTALGMGDPSTALKTAAMIPRASEIRQEPDFLWMLASAHFLSREYAAAEHPLLDLFHSSHSSENQKAAAAYGLCGVYRKTGNPVEQIRFALWLNTAVRAGNMYLSNPSVIEDQSVYWAISGWDLDLLLDSEAPIEALQAFLMKYPAVPDVGPVKYSLAVRLARENRYEEAAQIYESIHASLRAARMRRLAELYADSMRIDSNVQQTQEAKYKLAKFLSANPERIYFNDALWQGVQRYAMTGSTESRLTGEERKALISRERKLRDDQEERWRAYLILRDVVRDSGKTDVGRNAAQLAVGCLRRISERFGRQDEIRKADLELSSWLRR